jgi:hypothetical protein
MGRANLPIALGYYKDESLSISARDCCNLYPHIPESQTITDGAVIGVSGVAQVAFSATNAFNRGGLEMGGIPYFVCGDKLFNVTFVEDAFGARTYTANDVSGAETIDGAALVSMSQNGDQLCIVSPGYASQFNAWIYTVAGGLVQITDSDFDGPVAGVSFKDGYFIFPKANSNKWFISDLRDGLSYNALDFASAESDPDNITAIFPLNGLLYVFGQKTVEPYQNIGGAGFPFERISSGIQQRGCLSAESLLEVSGQLIWIGSGENERPAIYATNGGLPQKLSPPSIDALIYSGGIDAVRSSYAMRWSERGHVFVAFTVPGVTTIVYDVTTGLWHRRESLDRFFRPQSWRVTSIVDAYSVLLVGDELSGKIGILSADIFYEYGEEIRRYVTPPPIDNGGKPFSIYQLELVAESGTSPISGQGSAPVVRLSVSYDGGRTYSPEISRLMGLTGEYRYPISWPALGRFPRSACFRIDISEPIKIVFVKLEAEVGT